jgi:hypothetical protein
MLARMPNSGTSLACGHALYGIGAAVAPLVATQFTIHVRLVQRYYLVGLGVSMLLMTSVAVVFQGRRAEEIVPVSHQKAVEENEKQEMEKALERAGRNTQPAAVRTQQSVGVEGIEADHGSVTLEHLNANARADPRQQPTPLTSATITPNASRPASGHVPMHVPIRLRESRATRVNRRKRRLIPYDQVGVEVAIGGWAVSTLRVIKAHVRPLSSSKSAGEGLRWVTWCQDTSAVSSPTTHTGRD